MPAPASPTPKGLLTQVLTWSLTMVPELLPPPDRLPACPLPQLPFPGEHQACSSLGQASSCRLLAQMVTGQASSEPSSQAHMPPLTVLTDLLYFLPESESEVPQSCATLCNPMDYSLPGSSVHGIMQARVLEWVAISFSRESS